MRLLTPTEEPVTIHARTQLGTFAQGEGKIATFELQQADIEAEANREDPTAVDAEPQQPLDAGGPTVRNNRVTSKTCFKNIRVFLHIPPPSWVEPVP